LLAKLSDMKGQELVDVQEEGGELRLTFKNGKKYSLKVQDGKFVFSSGEE
jgi:hypothetical protein